jgi:hypothetical protein
MTIDAAYVEGRGVRFGEFAGGAASSRVREALADLARASAPARMPTSVSTMTALLHLDPRGGGAALPAEELNGCRVLRHRHRRGDYYDPGGMSCYAAAVERCRAPIGARRGGAGARLASRAGLKRHAISGRRDRGLQQYAAWNAMLVAALFGPAPSTIRGGRGRGRALEPAASTRVGQGGPRAGGDADLLEDQVRSRLWRRSMFEHTGDAAWLIGRRESWSSVGRIRGSGVGVPSTWRGAGAADARSA